MPRVKYGPADSSMSPRFSGPRTFMRLPQVETTEGVDVAVIGIPTDDAVSFKSGARFGPEAIRSASVLLRPYNPLLAVDVVEHLSMAGTPPRCPATTSRRWSRSSGTWSRCTRPG
jgi:agmatinase